MLYSTYALIESLDKTCTRYKIEIQRVSKVKGQNVGNVTSFKYLGAVVSDDGSELEVLSRIAQATIALMKRSQFGEITTYLLNQR